MPLAVHDKPIGVRTRGELDPGLPHTVRAFMHGDRLFPPIREAADHLHARRSGRRQRERLSPPVAAAG